MAMITLAWAENRRGGGYQARAYYSEENGPKVARVCAVGDTPNTAMGIALHKCKEKCARRGIVATPAKSIGEVTPMQLHIWRF